MSPNDVEGTLITPQPPDVADPIGDQELWAILRRVAAELAPGFRDVSHHDDVLGDLALLAHERWIPEWFERQAEGGARVSLGLFLRDRMRDRLREERRRRARRANLIRHAPITAGFPAPDEPLAADELRAQVVQGSPELRRILAMREAGLDQTEIARRTRKSRRRSPAASR